AFHIPHSALRIWGPWQNPPTPIVYLHGSGPRRSGSRMRTTRNGPGGRALTTLVTALLHVGRASGAAQAPAQPDTTVPAGTVVGSVVAAQTGAPLDGALVLIAPTPGGALSAGGPGPSFWSAGRAARTDA